MKYTKKLLAAVMVMVMALALSAVPAFAADDGSITISNTTSGKTYTATKVFDATYSGTGADQKVSYTYTKAGETDNLLTALQGADSPFTLTQVGTTGTYTVKLKSGKTAADVSTFLTANKDLLPAGETKNGTGADLTFDNLAYGYYYITTTNGSVVTIDSALKDVTVIDKNQTSSFEKNIVEDGNNIKANEAGLNEDVNFKISVNATNFDGEEKVFKYVITDTLDPGMTYKAAPTVKVDGAAVTPASIVYYKADGTTTTTNLSEAQKAVITINWTEDGTKAADHIYGANAVIDVEYAAFLDPAKADQLVIGGTTNGNTNTAKVEYFKGKPDDGQPDETTPSGSLGEDKTDTFTTELTISKVDDSGNALQGAEFTLTGPEGAVVITTKDVFSESAEGTYWLLADGTYTTDDPTTPNEEDASLPKYDLSKYADYTDGDGLTQAASYKKYAKSQTTVITGAGQTQTDIKVEVGTDGKATFTGLGAGDYVLSETKVPDGYDPIADISFTISFDPNFTYDSDDKVTGYTAEFTTNNSDIQVSSDNKLSLTVENHTGTELPSTGGMGTTILYVIGAIMVLVAGVYLITKRRASKENDL